MEGGRGGGKLAAGVSVALLTPEWDRTCRDCETYLFDDSGDVVRKPARVGLPVLRAKGTPTPCGKCAKVPLSARSAGMDWRELRAMAMELTPENRAAWRFYRECRAVSHFPDDPIVRWAAAVLRDVYDAADRKPQEDFMGLVVTMLMRRR